jgi:hypothetical protein
MPSTAHFPWAATSAATLSLACALSLAGCSPGGFGRDTSPPAQAAEIVKTMVRSPDSFKRAGGEVLWQGQTRDGRPAYVTSVAFDSQNALGAMMRGCMLVAFHEDADGKIAWDPMWGVKDYTEEMPMLCQKHVPMEIKSTVGKAFADLNFKKGQAEPAT